MVRVIAIAGIVLMHVLANGNYDLSGFLFEKVIGTAGNFTILFMMVSAFGMCCGCTMGYNSYACRNCHIVMKIDQKRFCGQYIRLEIAIFTHCTKHSIYIRIHAVFLHNA